MVAIYVRQSLEKVDSISLDSQIKYCTDICEQNKWKYKIYRDSGYSGKNTDRPAFQKLLGDIKTRTVDKVIAYRLDRISRNIIDFGNLLQLFEQNNTGFISATESFDTTSPIGKAMVMIIMVFAQLERETIVARVTDNFYARAKRGTYVGGTVPFGYRTEKVLLDGKMSSILVLDNEATIKDIFYLFTVENKSIRSIAKKHGMPLPAITRILSNTFYIKADVNMYNWLKSKGYIIHNNIDSFNTDNGIQIFSKQKGTGKTREYTEISKQIAVIGLHKAVVESDKFLIAEKKLIHNKSKTVAKKEEGKHSFITGLVSCGICNHSIGARISNKIYRYAACSEYRFKGNCENNLTYKLGLLEEQIITTIKNNLLNINPEIIKKNKKVALDITENKNELMIRITKLDEQINNLVNAISNGTSLSVLLENKIKVYADEKVKLEKELVNLDINVVSSKSIVNSDEYISYLNKLNSIEQSSVEDKRNIINFFVDKITLKPDELKIYYRF